MTDPIFRRSSRSIGGNACVEVADRPNSAHVRDSKDSAGSVLAFPAGDWRSFTAAAKVGRFSR